MPLSIYTGERIGVKVIFKNVGFARIEDTQWRVVLKPDGIYDWEGPWIKTGPIEPNQEIEITPTSVPVPWGPGQLISVYLDAEILSATGAVIVSIKPVVDPWIHYFEVPQPTAAWIQISKAEPYVAGA